MDEKVLEIREKALKCLGETRIADGEADLNQILLDLSETDEEDLDLKFKTLENIHRYLSIKSKLKLLNSDLTALQKLASELRLDYDGKMKELREEKNLELKEILEIIKRNY